LFVIDEGYIIKDKYEFSGEEFDYIIYKIENSYSDFYYTIIVEKDDNIVDIIHQNGDEFGSAHFNKPSEWIYEADANFDGKADILIHLGRFGAQGLILYSCYLQHDSGFEKYENFSEISNPIIKSENKIILSSWRETGASHGYAVYSFVDGDFKRTEQLRIGMIYDFDTNELVLSWVDEILIDGEWQIRKKITQNDFDNECEQWYITLHQEYKHWKHIIYAE